LIVEHGQELGVRRLFYQVVTCPEEASPEGPSLACVPLEAVDVSVDIGPFEPVKRAALACHRTQAADTVYLLDQPAGSLMAEHYQLAWSADGWRPGAGATDLLADLVSWPGERALHE
jgi:LmbE family N-acetylglucosaminyl deacetylase